MKGFSFVLAALAVPVVLAAAGFAYAAGEARKPAIRYVDDRFGAILATPKKQALYYWSVEKRAGGNIRCTGSCAKAWPPVIIRSKTSVQRKVAGIRGTCTTTRRPDGRVQRKHNGLPGYTDSR